MVGALALTVWTLVVSTHREAQALAMGLAMGLATTAVVGVAATRKAPVVSAWITTWMT